MPKNTKNRVVSEKLLLARGYTWNTIQETLKLSNKQISDDKRKIEEEKGDLLAEEDILKTYNWYKELAMQTIADLAIAAASGDSTAGVVSALKSKEQVAANVIKVAQEMGLLPKTADRTEHQGTHNVVVRLEDKESVIDLIAKHLGGEESEGDKDGS